MTLRYLFRVLLALFLLIPGAARPTSLERMSLERLVAAADVVARVRYLGSDARWEGGEIWTFAHFEVVEALKGTAPHRITVRLLGGRVGHWISTVDGVPRFHPREEAILFLEPTPAGDFTVTGWIQGTFRIHRDPGTGEERVTQDAEARGVFDPATRRFRATSIRNLPFELFKQRVTAASQYPKGR